MLRRGIAVAGRFLIGSALLVALPALAARDVVLVLDNSGSMRANDPARLAAPAVMEFIRNQPPDTRVAIVLFAAQAELALPLMPAEVAADGEAETALRKFSYRGAWTQIAAGVERGLYELRSEGRPEATRAIVLMTDGFVDTGDKRRDAELHQWLRQDLANQARDQGVNILGIAFTERADFQLLQSLAATTGGEYFRVLSADGIGRTLKRIDAVLDIAAAGEPAAGAQTPASTPPPETATPEPAQGTADAVTGAADEGGDWFWWALSALALLAIAVALGWAFRLTRHTVGRGAKASAAGEEDAEHDGGPKAVLFNGFERHELGAHPVVIGRAGGTDPTRQYIIVPEKTVGRWHATIERRGQTFWVRDEGSVNGTFINDERVIGEQPLKHRDTLRVHTHAYEFEIPELADADRTMLSPKQRRLSS
jgi:hypothetical protein